jgi:hypothetical protein
MSNLSTTEQREVSKWNLFKINDFSFFCKHGQASKFLFYFFVDKSKQLEEIFDWEYKSL